MSISFTLRRILAHCSSLLGFGLAIWPGHGSAQPSVQQNAPLQACLDTPLDDPARTAGMATDLLASVSLPPATRLLATDCLRQARLMLGQGQATTAATEDLLSQLASHHDLPEALASQARLHAASTLAYLGQAAVNEQVFVDTYIDARNRHDRRLQVAALTAIGVLFTDSLHHATEARGYLQAAVQLAQQGGQPAQAPRLALMQAEIVVNHADTARQLLADLRHDLAPGAGQRSTELRLNTAEARIDLIVQQPWLALPLLQRTLPAQREMQDMVGAQASLLAMGLAELYLNRPEDARQHSLEALQLAQLAHSDLIPSLHQLLDISLKTQTKSDIDRYEQQLMQLGSLSQRLAWRQQMNTVIAQLGRPSVTEPLPSRPPMTASTPAPDRHDPGHWLIGSSLLLGGAGLSLAWHQRRYFRRRLQLSTIDPLCQVLTRRETMLRLDAQAAAVPRLGEPAAPLLLMLIDVDHFKQINDRHGHLTGDAVLAEIAARLKTSCREQDILGRWGGEEFLLAGRTQDALSAATLAMRICASVASTPIATGTGANIPVTVSIGATLWPFVPDDLAAGDWRDVLLPADTALYAVKRSGRNGWATLHGTAQARPYAIERLLQDPAAAQAQGLLTILSNHPLRWIPPASPPADRKRSS